jgi:exopolyphosphatase/guanosine-5'-triphosphate,3'-diphosphate pyrophosphatase
MNGIIDVGSNSVRLLFNNNKYNLTTQLSEGLMNTNLLNGKAIQRTCKAIVELYTFAQSSGAEKTFVFATEAVRSAKNSKEFVDLLKTYNITLDVLSPEMEAKIGFLGAYNDGVKAVLDVGGASSELAVGNSNNLIYSHSLPLGSVRLKDYSLDKNVLKKYVNTRVFEYGKVPEFDELLSIGGTSSGLVSILLGLEKYDTDIVHNFVLSYDDLNATVDRILKTPISERINIKGMHPKKTTILPCGGILISTIMEYLNINHIRISEKDNLEGYAFIKNIEL